MELLSNNKRYLMAVEAIAIISLAVCLLSLRHEGEVSINSWQAIGAYVSGVIFSIAFFPLCYLAWFRNTKKTTLYYFKQTFYWVLALSFAVIFIVIGSMFHANS